MPCLQSLQPALEPTPCMLTSFFRLRLSASSAPSLLCALMVVLLRRRRCTRRSGGWPSLPAAAAGEAPDDTVMCAQTCSATTIAYLFDLVLPTQLASCAKFFGMTQQSCGWFHPCLRRVRKPFLQCIFVPSSSSLSPAVIPKQGCKNVALTNFTKQLPAQGQLWTQQIQGASVQVTHDSSVQTAECWCAVTHTSQA